MPLAANHAAVALCLALGAALPAGAGTPAALGPASVRDFAWVSDPQAGSDGRVAFVRTGVDRERDEYSTDVWLAEPGKPARPLTSDPAADLQPRWSPDGRRLAFLSARGGKPQVWVLELAGGEPWPLTDVGDAVSAFAWAPDGGRIAFVTRALPPEEKAKQPPERDPKHAKAAFVSERLFTRFDGVPGWLPAARAQLWVVPTDAGAKAAAKRITGGDADHGRPDWSADGTTLYFSGLLRDDADWVRPDSELYAVPADGSAPPRALTDRRGPDDDPVVSPDGRYVAYTGYDLGERKPSHAVTRLYVLDTRTGVSRRLAAGLDRSVADVGIVDMGAPRGGDGERLAWRADSRALYFTSADRGQTHLYEATLDGRVRQLTRYAQGEIRAFAAGPDGRFAATWSDAATPGELYTFGLREAPRREAWRAATAFNADLAARAGFVPYEEVWFDGAAERFAIFDGQPADGPQRIQGWIVRPPGFDPARKHPLVLYVHGGPHAMYGTGFFHEFQVLAQAGYVVLITNPRGSTGYGEAFANSVQYRYPGDDYVDLMNGVEALLARGYVDPARMAIAGGSGGGLLASWAIAHTTRFRAAVVERAVTNWHTFAGTADLNRFFVQHWFRDYPWRDPDDYLARSPLTHVDRVETPALVIHNADDFRTPLDQGLQYYAALRMLRKPAKLAVFPDSSHGMSRDGRPSQRVERMELILDWFDRHLGGSGPAPPAAR